MLRHVQSAGRVALAGIAHRDKADGCFEQLARTRARAIAGSSSTDAPRRLSKMSTSGLMMTYIAITMIELPRLPCRQKTLTSLNALCHKTAFSSTTTKVFSTLRHIQQSTPRLRFLSQGVHPLV
jgi:hypothetical protein